MSEITIASRLLGLLAIPALALLALIVFLQRARRRGALTAMA